MKKLTTLLLAAGLVVSSFTGAQASTSFQMDGHIVNAYTWGTAGTIYGSFAPYNTFTARQRIEVGTKFNFGESVSARFLVRVLDNNPDVPFGVNYGNGEFDASYASSLYVREAYLDWLIPSTDVKVRMGYRPAPLPGLAFANVVLDVTARASGITIAAPINENISATFMWNRLSTTRSGDGAAATDGSGNENNFDLFSIAGDFNYDGFRFTPWFMYGSKGLGVESTQTWATYTGNNAVGYSYFMEQDMADSKADYYWIGASFELSMFDPFRFAIDAFYNQAKYATGNLSGNGGSLTEKGFFVAASAQYKTSNGTPGIKAWYATGPDKDDADDERSGIIALASHFRASSMMADFVIGDGFNNLYANSSPQSTWGVRLEWANFSFLEKLSHTAHVVYTQGTGDLEDGYLNASALMKGELDSEDSMLEFGLHSRYQIYKNFFTFLQLDYIINDFDSGNYTSEQDANVARASIGFLYAF